MNDFTFKSNILHVEKVSIKNLIKKFGTPFYCYSANTIIKKFNEFKKHFGNSNAIICYAVKANPNIAILKILSKLGCGAEVVSIGELLRTLKAGIPNNKIVFSGVGKTYEELEYAIKKNILQINFESFEELELILKISKKLKKKVNLGLRINPNVNAKTHSKITTGTKNDKFGLDIKTAEKIYKNYNNNPSVKTMGLSIHIGSQITNITPFVKAFSKIKKLIKKMKKNKIIINNLDLGGGIGIRYNKERTISIASYAKKVLSISKQLKCNIILEPGRILVAESGILVSKILYIKKNTKNNFAIIDAGMNDLMRPALYNSEHSIETIIQKRKGSKKNYTVVGPICETTDTFIKKHSINKLKMNDLIFFKNVGAYGASMSSTYNSRPIIPEIMVYKKHFGIVRNKENVIKQIAKEKIPNWILKIKN